MNTRDQIIQKCKELQDLLISKNDKYGDSALEPLKVFSVCNASTGIKVRLDDKLKRIANAGLVNDTEDTLQDIAGYIILLMIAKDNESNNIQRRKNVKSTSSHTAGDSTVSYSEWEEQGSDT